MEEQPANILAWLWLHSGFILTTFWLHTVYILSVFWLHSGIILATYWLHSGFILTTFLQHSGYPLVTYCFQSGDNLITLCLHSAYILATFLLHTDYILTDTDITNFRSIVLDDQSSKKIYKAIHLYNFLLVLQLLFFPNVCSPPTTVAAILGFKNRAKVRAEISKMKKGADERIKEIHWWDEDENGGFVVNLLQPLGRGQLGQSSPPDFSSTHEMVGLDSLEMIC